MTGAPFSVRVGYPVAVALKLMADRGIRHLPVIDNGKLVGLLGEREILQADPTKAVEELMTRDAYVVGPDASAENVLTEMAGQKRGVVLVVENGKIIGLFTTTDALRLLAKKLAAESRKTAA